MASYRLTSWARAGLRGILVYVEAEFGARVAERVLDKLIAAFEQLANSPGSGHQRTDLTVSKQVRFWSVPPTLIAYRFVDGAVEVLFVERGERDWGQLWPAHDSPGVSPGLRRYPEIALRRAVGPASSGDCRLAPALRASSL